MTSLCLWSKLVIFILWWPLFEIIGLACVKIYWVLETIGEFFRVLLLGFYLLNFFEWNNFLFKTLFIRNMFKILNMSWFILNSRLYKRFRKFSFMFRFTFIKWWFLCKKVRKILCILSFYLLFLNNGTMQIRFTKSSEIVHFWHRLCFDVKDRDYIWLLKISWIFYESGVLFCLHCVNSFSCFFQWS